MCPVYGKLEKFEGSKTVGCTVQEAGAARPTHHWWHSELIRGDATEKCDTAVLIIVISLAYSYHLLASLRRR